MEIKQEETPQKKHEHSYYPTEIYQLGNFDYVIVKLECECGEVEWDVGDRVDSEA